MSELNDLCHTLDSIVLDYFDTLDEIYQRQSQLEAVMKDGLFFMSKARYSMGATRVSTLQIPEEDLGEAQYHVNTTHTAHSALQYSLTSNTSDCDPKTASSVRKRNPPGQTPSPTTDGGFEIVNVKVSPEDEKTTDTREDCQPKRDPLNWFGVLVPQALRQSQDRFRRVVQHACSLATLQSQLLSHKQRYRQLLAKKLDILGDTNTKSSPISDSSDVSSNIEELTADLGSQD